MRRLIYFFLLLILSHSTFAQSRKELEKKKQQIQKEINMVSDLLEQTKKSEKKSINQLQKLNKKISLREELISTITAEVALLDKQIAESNDILNTLTNDLKKLKDEYAKMLYFAHKNRSSYDKLMFVFSAKDFNQAYRRLTYFQQYSEYRKKQAQLILATQSAINFRVKELELKRNNQYALLHGKEEEMTILTNEKTEKEHVFQELKGKEKQLKADLKKKHEDADKLQKAIQKIIADEIRKAREEAEREEKARVKREAEKRKAAEAEKLKKKDKNKPAVVAEKPEPKTPVVPSKTEEDIELTGNFENNRMRLPWPVQDGVITSTFGEHEHPVLKGVKVRNNGIDIGTKQNASVRAVFEGEVRGVFTMPGAGKAILIKHGDYFSVYSNLAQANVKVGEKVSTKQTIGTVLSEDDKSEMNLQIWKGSVMLNPAAWIMSRN